MRFLLAGIVAVACKGGGPNCADCGPCGIQGGPTTADEVHLEGGGDESGRAVVVLKFIPEGNCSAEFTTAKSLVWIDSTETVQVVEEAVSVQQCTWVTVEEGSSCWVGDTSITVTNTGQSEFHVEFSGVSDSSAWDCGPGDGEPDCVEVG